MKLLKSKKGADAFSLVVTIIAMVALTLVLVGATIKHNNLANTVGIAGTNALRILGSYEKGDSALLYLDTAARLSMEKAAFQAGQRGFYKAASSCGENGGYAKWSDGYASKIGGEEECEAQLQQCIPTNHFAFKEFLSEELDRHILSYNVERDVELLQDNYDFNVEKIEGKTEVVGNATEPIVVRGRNLEYKVKPSFRERIDADVVGDFLELKAKAADLIGKEEGDLNNKLNDYNEENPKLRWKLDSYSESCGNQCDVGNECWLCREECAIVEEEECTGEEEEGEECPVVEREDCDTVCDIPGYEAHLYCEVDARISVTVIDERYKSDANEEGYKLFLSESGSEPYAYKFALNWVEMGSVQCFEK